MHDRTGQPLTVGDSVIFVGKIVELNPTEEYCNVSVESKYGRKPDGMKERVSAINTAVLDKVN